MKNKKLILYILLIIIILLTVVIATYAYMNIRQKNYGDFDVDIKSKGVDLLEMSNLKDASIIADEINFGPGYGETQTDYSLLEIDLTTTNDKVKYCYNVNVVLPEEQIFVYSTEDKKPELVLNVYKSTDNENYEKVIDSLDITESIGTIEIPSMLNKQNYKNLIEATSSSKSTVYWKAEISYIWLENDLQDVNNKKEYNASLKATLVDC